MLVFAAGRVFACRIAGRKLLVTGVAASTFGAAVRATGLGAALLPGVLVAPVTPAGTLGVTAAGPVVGVLAGLVVAGAAAAGIVGAACPNPVLTGAVSDWTGPGNNPVTLVSSWLVTDPGWVGSTELSTPWAWAPTSDKGVPPNATAGLESVFAATARAAGAKLATAPVAVGTRPVTAA